MNAVPTFKELVACINSTGEDFASRCSVGIFANEIYAEAEDPLGAIKEIESFIVKKPQIDISCFTSDNDIFYNVRFTFRSFDDADYKQMWKFLCKYAERAKREAVISQDGQQLEKITALTISLVPEKFNGKYFISINMPYWETISRAENAFDQSAEISFTCVDESLEALIADDDLIDNRLIEREVERELEAELGV